MNTPISIEKSTSPPSDKMGLRLPEASVRPSLWLATWTLWQREVVRFLRQRSRIIGALGTPVVFWILIGSGLGRSFRPPGSSADINYLEYFFPGTLVMILLFTAIFSTISVIEDRREGFLQSVLVSPAPRWSIVLGKILGGTTLAWGQGLLFCVLAPLSGIHLTAGSMVELAVVVFIVSFGLTGLGFLVAWPMDSMQGYHAIMNVVLIPMWLMSGALFPASGAPAIVRWVMLVNPVTYSVSAVRGVFYDDVAAVAGRGLPGFGVSLAVSVAFGIVMLVACVLLANRNKGVPT
jgi:ABC-2 type transport system permease protein